MDMETERKELLEQFDEMRKGVTGLRTFVQAFDAYEELLDESQADMLRHLAEKAEAFVMGYDFCAGVLLQKLAIAREKAVQEGES